MSQHVPDDLLGSFVEGEVGEQLAIHIAEHLDLCPACSTRAAGMEPLGLAFAAVEDPIPPLDLVQAVLDEVAEPERLPLAEIGVGAGLLVAATLLTISVENPLGMAVEVGVVLHAFPNIASALAAGLGASSGLLTVATFLALLGCAFTARLANSALLAPKSGHPFGLDRFGRLP